MKLSIFFSSVFTNFGAYLDKLLNACMYFVRAFVPYVSFINIAAFIGINPGEYDAPKCCLELLLGNICSSR